MGRPLTEETARRLIERFAKKQRGEHFACPRCGGMTMDPQSVARNALSRRANVQVCDACGTEEALEDARVLPKTPLEEWAVAKAPPGWRMLSGASDHIRVEGHTGTWYVIDEGDFVLTPNENDKLLTIHAHLFLLEHEQYGDEAACVIVDDSGRLILEDVWNGFDDLEDAGWASTNSPDDARSGETSDKVPEVQ